MAPGSRITSADLDALTALRDGPKTARAAGTNRDRMLRLCRAELVRVVGTASGEGPGRPQNVYALTDAGRSARG
jgi:hypothetical protein